jgi:hypothetical protein
MIQTLDVAMCQFSARSPSPLKVPGLRSLKLPQECGRRLGFCKGGMEGGERWVKMMAKVELPNPRLLGEYIGEGSTGLEGNRDIKLLSFWHIFSKRDHTVLMKVRMGCMPFVVAANDF